MKKRALYLCLAVLGITAILVPAAFAEEGSPGGLNPADLKKALGLSIYLQGGYTYNGNASTGEINDLRVFDVKANSFMLDLAELVFAKDPATGSIGYKVKISAGETAKFIHSAGLGTQPTGTANPESFDITEAFISYTAPVGKGLRFDIGKFVTYHGAEVIEAIDNPNYSRSFLFNYAIPFTHTGVRVSYAFTDSLSAVLHIVNGWDNSTDNNRAKSFGGSLTYAPAEAFSLIVNGMIGPEQDNNNSNKRTLLDVVATIKPIKNLAVILNYDNAAEEIGAGAADVKWNGVAGIVKYDFTDRYSLAVRAESFDDRDGVRTGTAQKLKEVTVTPEIRLNGNLIVRPEYRHDISDQEAFDNGTKKSQDTIALGVMYRW